MTPSKIKKQPSCDTWPWAKTVFHTSPHRLLDSLGTYFGGVSSPPHFWNCSFLQWGDGVARAQTLQFRVGLNPGCHPPVTVYGLLNISEPQFPYPQNGAKHGPRRGSL